MENGICKPCLLLLYIHIIHIQAVSSKTSPLTHTHTYRKRHLGLVFCFDVYVEDFYSTAKVLNSIFKIMWIKYDKERTVKTFFYLFLDNLIVAVLCRGLYESLGSPSVNVRLSIWHFLKNSLCLYTTEHISHTYIYCHNSQHNLHRQRRLFTTLECRIYAPITHIYI